MFIKQGVLNFSGVSAGRYINSDPIDVSNDSLNGVFNLWSCVTGDPGKTGSGVSIAWSGCFKKSGTTYYVTPDGTPFIRDSGSSVNGPKSNGVDASTFTPDLFPFIKLKGKHDGSDTTSTVQVNYVLMVS